MENNEPRLEAPDDTERLRDNPIVDIAWKHGLIGSVAVNRLIETIGEMENE